MASVQERIGNLGKMFVGFNIGNDDAGKQFVYLELVFPQGWIVSGSIHDRFQVNVVKNESGNGYYFWAPIDVGFDAVFDAADFNIRANREIQEKKDFLAEKMKELQQLVLEEDMSVLKTLEFKVKKKTEEVNEQETHEDGADTQE